MPGNGSPSPPTAPLCRYQYTLYKEASSDVSDILSGHADIDVEGVSWSSGSSGSFDIVARNDAPLPAGRYTVSWAAAGWVHGLVCQPQLATCCRSVGNMGPKWNRHSSHRRRCSSPVHSLSLPELTPALRRCTSGP